jgi:hypothetical protein
MPRQHGFVVGELVFAIASLGLIWATMEGADSSLERVCVGRGTTPNDAETRTVPTDVRRWLCVPLSIEVPEFSFVVHIERASARNPNVRTTGERRR